LNDDEEEEEEEEEEIEEEEEEKKEKKFHEITYYMAGLSVLPVRSKEMSQRNLRMNTNLKLTSEKETKTNNKTSAIQQNLLIPWLKSCLSTTLQASP
jgi:hypothetical protein